ncbi:ribosomal protein S18-alanine N-acetyltransferase [Chelativorans sp. AA-79]|uniref:ribosomal protein S18-alanine N-acetyltransferase n=1 Tax=Chelativorans sp. AA-79 TaxID=3028735 RepID=UPI0023F83D0B|nr:ribosomal protein S18-alanine N-acetyltransferase [Chelativorans sp. AA-79]WEX09252.1 ribosomal protein S18-alanine N-acetyltransferase [Chelativorans sp. AA-79]
MALSLSRLLRRSFAVRPLEIADSLALAALHEEDFVRPWTDGEFESLLSQETVFGFAAIEEGAGARPCGFVLARRAAGEAEILTLTVSRALRRRGIGRMLMDAILRTLHAERAEALFLEVDESNMPAIALYRRLGFRQVGRRPDYYRDAFAHRSSALVMRRDLR